MFYNMVDPATVQRYEKPPMIDEKTWQQVNDATHTHALPTTTAATTFLAQAQKSTCKFDLKHTHIMRCAI